MAEYIEREALLGSIGLTQLHFVAHGDNKSLYDIINEQPAADVAPVVHGWWENITIAVVDTTGYCGVCGEKAVWRSRNKPYAICPNCGANMDAEVRKTD